MADNEEQQQAEAIEEVPAQVEQSAAVDTEEAGGDATEQSNGQTQAQAQAQAEDVAEEKPTAQEENDDDDDSDNEDDRKLFVGGLSWDTQENGLKDFMSQYGEVDSCTVKTDQNTGRSRCFGFVVFKEVAGLEKALEGRPHKVDGKKIDSKKAEPQQKREGKLFVGGVKPETEDEKIQEYFSQYGKIVKIDRPKDMASNKYKSFCFITFKKDGAVAKVTKQRYHQLDEKDVECKHADPPFNERGGGGRGRGGRGRGNYGNQGFGGFGYWPEPAYGGFGNFQGGFGGQWGAGPGFNPYGRGAFGGGYRGGYGPSGFGKSGRGGRHQNNFKPY